MGNTGIFFIFLIISLVGSERLVSMGEGRVPNSHDYFLSCKTPDDKFNVELEGDMIFRCPCVPEIMKLRCQGKFRSFPYDHPALEANNKGCRNAEIPTFSFRSLHENLYCECSSRQFVFQCTGVRVAISM